MKEVKKYIDDAVTKTVAELKRQGLLVENRQTSFQKTEQLLYNYNNFRKAIRDKDEKINELKKSGIRKKSKSITSFNGGEYEMVTDAEKVEDKIKEIKDSIAITRSLLAVVDDALEKLQSDQYFDIIRMRYFEELPREKIAELLQVDVSTVSRNKNRLVNVLKIMLFSDDAIMEIFS